MIRSRAIPFAIAAIAGIFLFVLCSRIQAGAYLVFIDDDAGEAILRREPEVKSFLEHIANSCENHSIKVFSRTGVSFQTKRSKLLTHSYYLLLCDNGEYHTLSFYGTKMSFRSEGAWALDTDADKASYEMYLAADNRWDVAELFTGRAIDVKRTVTNIIDKIDSGVTYYYKDHLKDLPGADNCNTALRESVTLK